MTLEIPRQILENIQVSNLTKIRPVVPCGWTDRHMTKLILAFRNFAKNAKNDKYLSYFCNCSSIGTVAWCHVACVEVVSHAVISGEVC